MYCKNYIINYYFITVSVFALVVYVDVSICTKCSFTSATHVQSGKRDVYC